MEFILSLLFNICAFIVVISIVVFVHEFGHYIVAKVSGVRIEAFSIGFGKEIFGKNDKSGTRWKVCWLPFGGYVKMFGDAGASSSPDNEKLNEMSDDDKKWAFHHKPLPIKAAVVSAGPIANFLLAIVLATGLYMTQGKPSTLPIASEVQEDSAAQKAGILAGDVIISLDGKQMETFDDVRRHVGLNTGEPIDVAIDRDGKTVILVVTPDFITVEDILGDEIQFPLLGIQSTEISFATLSFMPAMVAATKETYDIAAATLKAIGQMVTGHRDPTQISGPIGIAKLSGDFASQGTATFVLFIILLSVNLGLINLFPIPALDGGHLLYYAIEATKGSPLAEKYQEYGVRVGIAIILALMVFAVLNDIRKLM